MSMSDDPRGFRRGHPGNRDYSASQQGRGGRGDAPRDDHYDSYRQQPEPPAPRGDRQPEKQQPSFSAYRPEAYAGAKERGAPRPERSEWDAPRSAPPPPPPPRSAPPMPAPDPFPRTPQGRDPYNAASDPYAPPAQRGGYDKDWRNDPYDDQAPSQFPSFYPPDEPNSGDVQSVHDRFFAPEPDHAPPPPARFQGSFDDQDFGSDQGYGGGASYPAQRHTGIHGASSGFDDQHDHHDDEWEKFEQAPAPSSVRPFHPPATIPEDDLDADFFADEDDYEHDDYVQEKRGGRKKLMAAVLIGAVVTGGGLAYVYKSNGPGDDSPSVIAADTRPVKEEPEEPGGRDFPNGNKLIYDRLGGAAQEGDGGGARLASGGPSERSAPGVITTGGTLEERIENALKAQRDEEPTGSNRKAGSPDAPRTVRTVTYGPDGTQQAIEPKTQRIAANTSADVSSGIVVTTTPTSSDSGLGSQDSDTDAEAQAPQAAPARQARVAAVAPPAQPAAAPQISESAGGSGNFFVQIAARNDQDAAMQAFASLQQKYAGALGNHSPSVRKVDLGEKGVWYRLLVGPVETKGEADQLCEQLKTAGMKSCFARKD
jgi:cell division septation protein DedD